MDNTEEIKVLSLCAGYGGLEIGLAGALQAIFRVVAVEVEAFALANLVAKAEEGKLAIEALWPDLRTFPAERFRECFDIITAGYPCQPFSVAGKRQGKDDPRHLWPHIERIIEAVQPVWFFGENVSGHLTLGFPTVYRSLRNLGYTVEAGLFTAAECGAPHNRQRLYILAHSSLSRRTSSFFINRKNAVSHHKAWDAAKNIGSWEGWRCWLNKICKDSDGIVSKADFYRVDDGNRKEMDQFRLLGSGVVPQQAEKAFRTLMELFV